MNTKVTFGKIILWGFCILIPAIAIGFSNQSVFPDSISMATMLLAVTVGVSAVMTYYSGGKVIAQSATDEERERNMLIRRYAIIVEIVIGLVLWVNLAGHWQLAREVSAAKDAVADRHTEEDRALKMDRERAAMRLAQEESTRRLAEQQAKNMRLLPREQRSLVAAPVQSAPIPNAIPFASAPADAKDAIPESRLTPEMVRSAWNHWLMILAYIEVGLAIIGGLGMLALWNWNEPGKSPRQ